MILDRKKDKNSDVGLFELGYKQATVDVPLYVGKALNVIMLRNCLNPTLTNLQMTYCVGCVRSLLCWLCEEPAVLVV